MFPKKRRPSAAAQDDSAQRPIGAGGRPRPSAAVQEDSAQRPFAAGTRPRPSAAVQGAEEDDGDAERVPFDAQAQWDRELRRKKEQVIVKDTNVQAHVIMQILEHAKEAQAMRRQTGPGT